MSPRRAERETNEVDPKIFSGNCINAVATFEISSEMRNIFTRSRKRCHTRTFFRQRKRFFCLLRNIIFERLISKKSFYPLRHSFPASFQKIINSSFSFYLIFIWLLFDYKYTCFRFFFFFCSYKKRKGRKEGRYSKVFQTWRRVNLRGSEYLHSTSHPFCSRLSSPSRIVSRVGRHRLFLPSFEEAEYLHRLPCP